MIYVKNDDLYQYQRMVQHFCLNQNVLSAALSIDQIIREEPAKAWEIILTGLRTIPSKILFEDFVQEYFYMFLSLHGYDYLTKIEKDLVENVCLYRAFDIVLNYKSSFWKIPELVLSKLAQLNSVKRDKSYKKDDTCQNIINSWLVYETTSWAGNELDELVKDNPDLALEIIMELIHHADSPETLAYIAAGALENLLDAHSYELIEKVETKAANSRKFRLCLSGVWQRDIPEEIWERLKVAIKEERFCG